MHLNVMQPALAPRDPLAAYMCGAVVVESGAPMPLVDTRYHVLIDAGLAVVTTTRVFRNAEAESIEATITFPVPVRAVLFGLVARIGDRTLNAKAKARVAARETYEGAIESGKTAVLHEEVLKGVHKLSVGHVPPGAEVSIETKWVMPLALVGGRGHLRIPLTTGDIYGRSPLSAEDDLVTGGPQQAGKLKVEAQGGGVLLHGKPLGTEEKLIPLNRPIDLSVPAWSPRGIITEDASGKKSTLTLRPTPQGEERLNLAILVDHSSSMTTLASILDESTTCHGLLKKGLLTASDSLQVGDQVCLWEFDDTANSVGSTEAWQMAAGAPRSINELFRSLVGRLADPHGGTEIGGALAAVIGNEPQVDILLITDGQSYALDVQRLARHRRRISVILIGEASLEANVGHLAALTGGDVFVATPEDVDQVVATALMSMRVRHQTGERIEGCWSQSGVEIRLNAGPIDEPADAGLSRAGAALVAALRMTDLAEDDAANLAEAEGLVTHLTSLILVDEAGELQEGVPQTRKVALPDAGVEMFSIVPSMFSIDPSSRYKLNARVVASALAFSACMADEIVPAIDPLMLPWLKFPRKPAVLRPIVILMGGDEEERLKLGNELRFRGWDVHLVSDEGELLKQLRVLPKRRGIRVILLAGSENQGQVAKLALRHGRRVRVVMLDASATEAPGTVSEIKPRLYRSCGTQDVDDLEAALKLVK